MKGLVLNNSIKLIRNIYPNYDDNKIDRVRYGLEAVYLTLTKTIVILLLSSYLGLLKDTLILLLFFNLLRLTGFGLHASKSWICLITSITMFIGCPLLMRVITFNIEEIIFICSLSFISFLIFAPADTIKRPLVKKKKRIRYKIITLITCIIYSFLSFYINNQLIRNSLLFAMLIEVIIVNPIIYKLFGMPFNNYKTYVFKNKKNV